MSLVIIKNNTNTTQLKKNIVFITDSVKQELLHYTITVKDSLQI